MSEQQQQKKNHIPRGPAATRAKGKYKRNNYDSIEVVVPRGLKKVIQEVAKKQGQSTSAYIVQATKERFRREEGTELMRKMEE